MESTRRRREFVGLRVLFCEYAMQGALSPHPTLLAFTNIKQAYTGTVDIATSPILEGRGCTRWFDGPILRMANARQSGAASHSAQFSKHQGGVKCPVTVLNTDAFGPATHTRQFEGPIWRNAQCEAVRRIPLGSVTQAPTTHHSRR